MSQEVVMISDASMRGFTYQAVAPEGKLKVIGCLLVVVDRFWVLPRVAEGC